MIIGIPKEIMPGEDRVSSSPATVAQMVKDGLTVLVEKGAGDGAFYHDDAYMEAGAEVVSSAQELYDRSDVILKVKEPLFNHDVNKSEVDMMHKGQLLITFIHLRRPRTTRWCRNWPTPASTVSRSKEFRVFHVLKDGRADLYEYLRRL